MAVQLRVGEKAYTIHNNQTRAAFAAPPLIFSPSDFKSVLSMFKLKLMEYLLKGFYSHHHQHRHCYDCKHVTWT